MVADTTVLPDSLGQIAALGGAMFNRLRAGTAAAPSHALKMLLRGLWAMKASLIGFVAAFALSFLSLGYISLALYGVVSPVLALFYPPLETWRGPWVWPVLVGVAILWSPSFLIAGAADLRLGATGRSNRLRWLAYLAILWLGALASWLVVLGLNWPQERP